MSDGTYNVKRARGIVLRTLKSYYPNGLTGRRIYRDVLLPHFHGIEWRETEQTLAYLEERGFVGRIGQCAPAAGDARENEVYRLTASGYDLATGVTTDDAIDAEV